ncbi:MAG: hypothetical protein ABI821_02395 [Pseudomonadota bacterium]
MGANGFCLGDERLQRDFAKALLKVARDGVRSKSSEEDSYPALVEAVAAEILQHKAGRSRFASIDHPFAKVATGAGEGDEFWRDVENALDLHLLMCDEGKAAGIYRLMNYPAVGFAMFPVSVLVSMKFAGTDLSSELPSTHPLLQLSTTRPPERLSFDWASDPTLQFMLKESAFG